MVPADILQALDRLNAAERELLILLGRGHTAKSIATMKGLSVAAVNERFRSARRKTGLGSSREIARLLVAQENRDDFIDLAAAPVQPPNPPRPNAPPLGRAFFTRRWRLIVITAALLAAGLLAYQTATPPVASPQTSTGNDPVAKILAGMPPSPDIATLHAEAAAPSTDQAWSSTTEETLSQRYHALPRFEKSVEVLSVTCAATLCEVAGKARPDVSSDDMTAFMEGVQGLGRSQPSLPLDAVVHHFSSTNGPSSAALFVSYWRRKD
jgi:DNA-binding CsgD family transcriptional regulator